MHRNQLRLGGSTTPTCVFRCVFRHVLVVAFFVLKAPLPFILPLEAFNAPSHSSKPSKLSSALFSTYASCSFAYISSNTPSSSVFEGAYSFFVFVLFFQSCLLSFFRFFRFQASKKRFCGFLLYVDKALPERCEDFFFLWLFFHFVFLLLSLFHWKGQNVHMRQLCFSPLKPPTYLAGQLARDGFVGF